MDPELEKLRSQVAFSEALRRAASEKFDQVLAEVPSHIPPPDGTDRFRLAGRDYRRALQMSTDAMVKLTDYLVRMSPPFENKAPTAVAPSSEQKFDLQEMNRLRTTDILIVAERLDERKAIEDCLKESACRCEIQIAHNPAEARQLLAAFKFDLIFLDDYLPEMGGRQLVRLIRTELNLDAVPLIMLTAASGADYIKSIHEAGVTIVMKKPGTLSHWVRVLKEIARASFEAASPPNVRSNASGV